MRVSVPGASADEAVDVVAQVGARPGLASDAVEGDVVRVLLRRRRDRRPAAPEAVDEVRGRLRARRCSQRPGAPACAAPRRGGTGGEGAGGGAAPAAPPRAAVPVVEEGVVAV